MTNTVKVSVERDGAVVAEVEGANFVDPRNNWWRNQTRTASRTGVMEVTLLGEVFSPKRVVDISSWPSSSVIASKDQNPLEDGEPYYYSEGDFLVLERKFLIPITANRTLRQLAFRLYATGSTNSFSCRLGVFSLPEEIELRNGDSVRVEYKFKGFRESSWSDFGNDDPCFVSLGGGQMAFKVLDVDGNEVSQEPREFEVLQSRHVWNDVTPDEAMKVLFPWVTGVTTYETSVTGSRPSGLAIFYSEGEDTPLIQLWDKRTIYSFRLYTSAYAVEGMSSREDLAGLFPEFLGRQLLGRDRELTFSLVIPSGPEGLTISRIFFPGLFGKSGHIYYYSAEMGRYPTKYGATTSDQLLGLSIGGMQNFGTPIARSLGAILLDSPVVVPPDHSLRLQFSLPIKYPRDASWDFPPCVAAEVKEGSTPVPLLLANGEETDVSRWLPSPLDSRTPMQVEGGLSSLLSATGTTVICRYRTSERGDVAYTVDAQEAGVSGKKVQFRARAYGTSDGCPGIRLAQRVGDVVSLLDSSFSEALSGDVYLLTLSVSGEIDPLATEVLLVLSQDGATTNSLRTTVFFNIELWIEDD